MGKCKHWLTTPVNHRAVVVSAAKPRDRDRKSKCCESDLSARPLAQWEHTSSSSESSSSCHSQIFPFHENQKFQNFSTFENFNFKMYFFNEPVFMYFLHGTSVTSSWTKTYLLKPLCEELSKQNDWSWPVSADLVEDSISVSSAGSTVTLWIELASPNRLPRI